MTITRLTTITDSQAEDILLLMKELDPEIEVSLAMVRRAVESRGTYFFGAMDEKGRMVGCASLCVMDSPTGRKGHIEDVVVLSSCRGQHLGQRLMEHVIGFSRQELGPVDLYLTSRPHRIAANRLYRSLGFQPKVTNVYKMIIDK